VAVSPRPTLPPILGLALALGALPACVGRGRLEQATEALRREQAEHAATARTLAAAEAAAARARAEQAVASRALHARELEVEALDRSLSGIELEAAVAERERGEQTLLVEQLRADLDRTGEHLRGFVRERGDLAAALDAATARLEALDGVAARAERRALLVRDLTLALHDPLATGEIELLLVDGEPVLRIPAARLFVEPDGALAPAAVPILDAVARVVAASETAAVVVTMTGGSGDRGADEDAARVARLSAELGQRGIGAERRSVAAPSLADSGDLAHVLGTAPEPELVELRVRA